MNTYLKIMEILWQSLFIFAAYKVGFDRGMATDRKLKIRDLYRTIQQVLPPLLQEAKMKLRNDPVLVGNEDKIRMVCIELNAEEFLK